MMRYQLYQHWLTRQWRWRLLAENNRIIAVSGESYHNKADCRHAIDLVRSSLLTSLVTEKWRKPRATGL